MNNFKKIEEYQKRLRKMTPDQIKIEWEAVTRRLNPNKKQVIVPGTTNSKRKHCNLCKYCEKGYRSMGRAFYKCKYPNLFEYVPKELWPNEGFIAFEDKKTGTAAIRTCPRWCPKMAEGSR